MRGMIRVTVRLSGAAAEAVGHETLEYGLIPEASLADLLELLYARYGRLQALSSRLSFAVNGRPCAADAGLAEGDEISVAAAAP